MTCTLRATPDHAAELARTQRAFNAACEAAAPADVPGVDLGVVQLAKTSDGDVCTGKVVNGLRARRRRLCRTLQTKGTRSAKRLLRGLRGRERRMRADVDHVVGKRIVRSAAWTDRAVALENPNGITKRLLGEVSRDQRRRLGGWAFHQLIAFLADKANAPGVRLVLVDPARTSQTCPQCGGVDRRNRPTQARCACVGRGFAGHADHVAAVNAAVRGRVDVLQPHASPLTAVDASRPL